MTLRIQSLTIDCLDPVPIAAFWAAALGWRCTDSSPEEAVLEPPLGNPENAPDLLFLRVPDGKSLKNRFHLDLCPTDQAAEIARVKDLGAVPVGIGQDGTESWVVLADPEGNEFCILSGRD